MTAAAVILIAQSAQGQGRVLTPESADVIKRAFDGLAPALKYESIAVDHDHVTAKLCQAGNASGCFTVRMDPPFSCNGINSGPFCISFPGGRPSADIETRIADAFGPHIINDVFHVPPMPVPAGHLGDDSVALFVFPIVLGWFVSMFLVFRLRRRFGGTISFVACFAFPVGAAIAWAMTARVIGLWDAVVEAGLVGGGLVLGGHQWLRPRKTLALATLSVLIGCGVIEFVARHFLPVPGILPFSVPHLLLSDARQDPQNPMEAICTVAYGDGAAGVFHQGGVRDRELPGRFPIRPDAKKRVLHVGDSMVYGEGVDSSSRFTTLLERMDPETQHLNAGAPGTGPDAYLITLRQWMKATPLDVVIMYLFDGNDLTDLDSPAPCCAGQSLLIYGESPSLRCPTATAAQSAWESIREASPAPYLVKTLSMVSYAAADTANAWLSAARPRASAFEPDSVRWAHFESILKAAHDELTRKGERFVVIVLPLRDGLGSAEADVVGQEMIRRSRALGIETLDAREPIAQMLKRGVDPFLSRNLHFSEAGHAEIARWIDDRLRKGH